MIPNGDRLADGEGIADGGTTSPTSRPIAAADLGITEYDDLIKPTRPSTWAISGGGLIDAQAD